MDHWLTTQFLLVFQCIFVFFLTDTKAFNMDTTWPLVFTGEENSLFGFSVALHHEGNQHMLLVGAPHTDNYDEIEREGAFYKCDINDLTYTGPCQQVQLDTEIGQPRNTNGHQIGTKSNSFLGATVRSGGTDGPVLVCAPSYVWYINPARRVNDDSANREPVGRCFIAQNNFSTIEIYEPCLYPNDKSTWYENKLTHCQAGTGGDISMDHVLVGGPGSFYWQGQIFRRRIADAASEKHTWEAPYSFDDSYRGYTVLLGDLNNDGRLDNVVGTPRAPNMFGEVSVYNHNLVSIHNKSGHQLGEYFGNSLAVTDLNNDGLNDLIVGAPMYTHQEQRTTNYEIGRIYIFYQKRAGRRAKLSSKKTVIGHNGRGRFGFSLAALGDINNDGYNDLAVGAPYDGDGAVFIYSGGPRGIITTPIQIIRPSNLENKIIALKGFGFSLSGQQDVDSNTYPDLGIGSHSSSAAVILRARPVISVEAEITFDVDSINLERPNFELSSSSLVPGFNVTTCVRYTGPGAADTLPFSFHLQLDSVKTVSSRAFIIDNGYSQSERTWETVLSKGVKDCVKYQAYIEKQIRDKLSPVIFKLSYNLEDEDIVLDPGQLMPILPDGSFVTEQLALLKNCSNARCLPDLSIETTHDLYEISVGKTETLMVNVDFENYADEAFEARLYAQMPAGVSFVQVERISNDVLVECVELAHLSGASQLRCDVGNPVPAKYKVPFVLHFEIYLDDKVNEFLEIHFIANSSNTDAVETFADNRNNISIPVRVSYELKFTGYSNPGQSVYSTNFTLNQNADEKKEQDYGEEIIHFYTFQNLGPSDIGNSRLTLHWPMYTVDDEYLLYLTTVTPSVGECIVPDDEINPKNLVLNRKNSSDEGDKAQNKRPKRKADEGDLPTAQPVVMIDCKTGKCITIECYFEKLGGSDLPIVLSIRSRLWLQTLTQGDDENILPSDWVISSTATVEVIESVYTLDNPLPDPLTSNATTKALPESQLSYVTSPFPWWAYIIAALIGFIVLTCLILTAWKLGFFKRKKIGEDEFAFKN